MIPELLFLYSKTPTFAQQIISIMENIEYLNRYERQLTELLLREVTRRRYLDGQLLHSDDLDEKWHQIAPDYVSDAVPQIAEYPSVALAWAGYVGMALAAYWDEDWQRYSRNPNLYLHLRDKQGFDLLDEYVLYKVLKLPEGGREATALEDLMRSCAHITLDLIRHEQIEPQSVLAFHVYARSIKVLFRIGAAVELKRRKYKYEKINLEKN